MLTMQITNILHIHDQRPSSRPEVPYTVFVTDEGHACHCKPRSEFLGQRVNGMELRTMRGRILEAMGVGWNASLPVADGKKLHYLGIDIEQLLVPNHALPQELPTKLTVPYKGEDSLIEWLELLLPLLRERHDIWPNQNVMEFFFVIPAPVAQV